jgi:single-strand DNA-binding protein
VIVGANFNKVILAGNLTRDPELRYTPSGTPVCELGLAVNDRRKNPNGEWVEETTFIDVTLWARQAEVAGEYLTKGSNVLIEGRLKFDQWEDKESGQKRSKLRVVGDRMQMLGGKGGGGTGGRAAPQYDESEAFGGDHGPPAGRPAGSKAPPDDDIPF